MSVEALEARDLNEFARKALTTWGELEDFKHLLPRILELAVVEGTLLTDTEIVIGKLRLGGWDRWPADEREAVEAFLLRIWIDAIMNADGGYVADIRLCAIGQAVDSMSVYLDAWLDDGGSRLASQWQFLDLNFESLRKRKRLGNAYWEGAVQQMNQVIEWLAGSPLRREMTERAGAGSNDAALILERLAMFDAFGVFQQ